MSGGLDLTADGHELGDDADGDLAGRDRPEGNSDRRVQAAKIDRALAQIDKSLAVDPRHVKSLLNQGIIRFGKEDRRGAAESWEKVVAIAPDSDEARMARQGLDGLKSGHGGGADSGRRGAGGGQ